MERGRQLGGNKLLIYFLLLFQVFFLSFWASISFAEEQGVSPLDISARSALLLDWNSGRVLYEKNAHEKLPIASTTKIVTAVVALEYGQLDEEVITSREAANTGGSSIWLEEDEVKTLEELLYGLMLRSGNDAAIALAEHISGDVLRFSQLMTLRAKELGSRNSSFKNPHGLHHPDHYSTAYDLAMVAAHAMGIPEFRKIITAQEKTISWPGQLWDRRLINQNRLLKLYPGGEGIKTGWTTPAGRCFVGSANREGRRLVSVVLNAPAMWEDTVTMLDYGFDHFISYPVIDQGQYLKAIPVTEGKTNKLRVLAGEQFSFPIQDLKEKKSFLFAF